MSGSADNPNNGVFHSTPGQLPPAVDNVKPVTLRLPPHAGPSVVGATQTGGLGPSSAIGQTVGGMSTGEKVAIGAAAIVGVVALYFALK